jgi:hypothetical protein
VDKDFTWNSVTAMVGIGILVDGHDNVSHLPSPLGKAATDIGIVSGFRTEK